MESRKKVFLPGACEKLLLTIPPRQTGLFRFLLEARDNLAIFTVLDRHEGLIKLSFAPESRESVLEALREINEDISLQWQKWPF